MVAYIISGIRLIKFKQALPIGLALIFAFSLLIKHGKRLKNGLYPTQVFSFQTIKGLNQILEPSTKIAIADAGIKGFHSEFITINLDGLVNSDLIPYLKSGNLYQFLRTYDVDIFFN